jgi:hypothetical protein
MSILDRIIEYSPQERTPKQEGGMLVKPSADGSRPGYKGPEQQFKPVEGAPARLTFDKDKNLYRKRVQVTVDGKKTNKYIYSKPGESLEQFMGRKPVRSTGADDATVLARNYVNNWTKNWFDQNLNKYGVKDFDGMLNDLANDWDVEIESGKVPKGSGKFNLSTPRLNLPNITTLNDTKTKKGLIPFEYNNVRFYTNLESSQEAKNKTLAQFKKVFYKNQIETNPVLRKDLDKFFNFMSQDKRGLYRTLDGKTIKQFMTTEVSDDVKYLLDPKVSGLDRASKYEVFNSYKDLADNYNKFTEDKVRLKAVQTEAEAMTKAGSKTTEQYKKVKANIKNQNDILSKMSVKNIAENKQLLNSVRMSINPQTGEVNFSNYTVNDPKGKPALTDLELAEKIKQKAKNGNFFVAEHISKKSFNKANLAFPNNLQLANYMSNSQLENARRFFEIAENRNTPNAKILDKTLENVGLTIRGPEYGGQKIGNKINIIYDSQTGRSNIIDSQSIGGQQFVKTEQNILKNITSYSKLPECKIGKADGGRIGFALSDTCIRDGLLEQKKLAASGNKKAAQELVDVAKVASKGSLLKNVLGPGALLGEAVFEGAIIGNKVLGGKPLDQAWAESYLSYLDPRKYRGELDPMLMERDRMLTRTVEDEEGNVIRKMDAPYSNLLKAGFSAQDQLSFANKAAAEAKRAKAAGRMDQYFPAAADAREQGARANLSASIISNDAFKEASKQAQEYLDAQEGKRRFDLGIYGTPQGSLAEDRRMYQANKAMQNLYSQYSDEDLIKMLEDAGYNPQDIIDLKKTERLTPSFAKTLGGLDVLRSQFQEQEAMQRIADAGGVANLAGGGIAEIRKPNSIPPQSGPTPQGLLSVKNNVKRY